MATAAVISPSEEKSYCFRLLSLTIDGGTLVLRHQFNGAIPPQDLKTKLNDHSVRGKLNNLRTKKVITKKQYDQLYPQIRDPTSEDFDVSLLACLLRYICNLDENSPLWDGRVPSSRDVSLIADIVRLKHIRNEFSHKQPLSLSQQEFTRKWIRTEEMILRLGHGIPDLAESIRNLKEGSIDPVKEKYYQDLIEEWEHSDSALTVQIASVKADIEKHAKDIGELQETAKAQQSKECEMNSNIQKQNEIIENIKTDQTKTFDYVLEIKAKHHSYAEKLLNISEEYWRIAEKTDENEKKQNTILERLDQTESSISSLKIVDTYPLTMELSEEQKILAEMTCICLEDRCRFSYVVTKAHLQAKEKLLKSRIVVLVGNPGEGKTSMGIQLLYEVSEPSTCLIIREPSDFKHINLYDKRFRAFFIDDIFGEGVLDETLLKGWNREIRLKRFTSYTGSYLIITSRNYVLKEAKERIQKCKLFEDENVQQLSSSELTDKERMQILAANLSFAKREKTGTFVKECNKLYKSTFVNDDSCMQADIENDLSPNDHTYEANAMVGFPEIAHIFAVNDYLFNEGVQFFRRPLAFFKRCLEEIYLDKSKFLALILIWAKKGNTLNISDIEPPYPVAKDIKDVIRLFGAQLTRGLLSTIRKFLKHHSGGLVRFSSKTGNYTFYHSIVRDMVGIVAAKDDPSAVFALASHEFLMNCTTTLKSRRDVFHIYVGEFRLKTLLRAIIKLLIPEVTRNEYIPELFFCDIIDPYTMSYHIWMQKSRDYSIPMMMPLCSDFIPSFVSLNLERHWDSDSIALFGHDAFENRRFINTFFESSESRVILSKPVAYFKHSCDYKRIYCICLDVFDEIYLPSFLLLYGNHTFLQEYLKNMFDPLSGRSQTFLYMSLLLAVDLDMENVVKTLLRYGALPNEDHLVIASAKNTKILDLLLKFSLWNTLEMSRINHKTNALIYASRRGFMESVQILLRNGVDVNYRNTNNRSALDKAVQYGKTEVCRILLENGAEVNEKVGKFKRTPLHMAADMGQDQRSDIHKIVELLLKNGASMETKDYRGHLPIHCAALRGHNKVVQILLKEDRTQIGLRITSYGNKSRIKGMTLLHIAVWKNNVELVKILLENNINSYVTDCFGRTPLYHAAFNGNMEIIRLLIGVSNPKQAEKNGYTPLHAATHRRHTEIAKLLCPHSYVNRQDRFGKTALHTACEKVNLEMIKVLVLEYKGDVRMVTKKGLSVFCLLKDKHIHCIVGDLVDKFGIQKKNEDKLKACRRFLEEIDPQFAAKYILNL